MAFVFRGVESRRQELCRLYLKGALMCPVWESVDNDGALVPVPRASDGATEWTESTALNDCAEHNAHNRLHHIPVLRCVVYRCPTDHWSADVSGWCIERGCRSMYEQCGLRPMPEARLTPHVAAIANEVCDPTVPFHQVAVAVPISRQWRSYIEPKPLADAPWQFAGYYQRALVVNRVMDEMLAREVAARALRHHRHQRGAVAIVEDQRVLSLHQARGGGCGKRK